MNDDFRAGATVEFAGLVAYWRQIEQWLKRAEQVNQSAIIPAINELRYASRQMINAVVHLGKSDLTDIDKKHISKRFVIAEQYLLNADHDIVDSITTFYGGICLKLDEEVGSPIVTQYLAEYPEFKKKLEECNDLIVESRFSYDERKKNYGLMKSDHLPYILEKYRSLRNAEILARSQREATQNAVVRAQGKVNALAIATYLGTFAALIAIPLTIYLWAFAKEDFCKVHEKTPVLNYVCPVRP